MNVSPCPSEVLGLAGVFYISASWAKLRLEERR